MSLAFRRADFEAFRDGTPAPVVPEAATFDAPSPAAAKPKSAERRGAMRPSRLALARRRLPRWTLRMVFRLADGAVLMAAAGLAAAVASATAPAAPGLAPAAPFLAASALLVWALGAFDAYGLGAAESLARHLTRLLAACGLAAVTLFAALAAFGTRWGVEPMALWFCLSLACLFAMHLLWWTRVRVWRRQGRLTPNIVVVGATANAQVLIRRMLESGEAAVLGVFDDRLGRAPGLVEGVPVLGDTDALIGHAIIPFVDRIVITVSSQARPRIRGLLERLAVLPNEIMLFVDHDSETARTAAFTRIIDVPLARLAGGPSDERKALVKRGQDLAIGALALVLCAPVMAAVALAIRMDSPGPIIFRQRRHGFNNESFFVW
jgi:hypothetical protein